MPHFFKSRSLGFRVRFLTSKFLPRRVFSAFLAVMVSFLAPLVSVYAKTPTKPVDVMIVGVFHMSNPGHDLHDAKVDDVLETKRQSEIAAITAALARFKPTKVGVEWAADVTSERYKQYLAGTLPTSRNEVVQLGFRLAKTVGAEGAYGLDADGDFPYERLQNFAESYGYKDLLDQQNALIQDGVEKETKILSEKGISADLRFLNDPELVRNANGFYRSMLYIGRHSDQPGVDLLTAWYRRNLQICANLLQLASSGDRIVVFFGAGHAFLLRQCVTETPGLRLIEPNDYLPR